jgi:hypothetical protein
MKESIIVWCEQCSMYCVVNPVTPRVNRTFETPYSPRCHGCQYANDTYASTQLWRGNRWYSDPDTRPSIKRNDRLYAYYGPIMPFAVWCDTWRHSHV